MPNIDHWLWCEWPIGSGEVLTTRSHVYHALEWFPLLGLPTSGLGFDEVLRGKAWVNHDTKTVGINMNAYAMLGRTEDREIPDALWQFFVEQYPDYSVIEAAPAY